MGNQVYKHKYETCEHTLRTLRNVDEFKRFIPIHKFIDKYKAFDVKTLTDAMKNMESTKTIPPEYLIRYAEYINLPRITLVMNLQHMLTMALTLKLNHDQNMVNAYNDTTKRLLNDVTEIINKHEIYSSVYPQDHNDLKTVQNVLSSEVTLIKKLGDMSVQNVVHSQHKSGSIMF